MKTLILFLLPSLFYFNTISKNEKKETNKCDYCIFKIDLSNTTDDYGTWSRDNCYRGIEYRLKKNKEYCTIQFRSIYLHQQCVSFSWEIWEDRNMTKSINTGNRVYCIGYEEEKEYNYVTKNDGVWITVKNLRFSKGDAGPYEACD